MDKRTYEENAGYACVTIHKPKGAPRPCFGSRISHVNYVEITVRRADKVLHPHEPDGFYAKGLKQNILCRFRMSQHQFETLVHGGANTHSGVPCTLEVFDGQDIPEIPQPASVNESSKRRGNKAVEALKVYTEGLVRRFDDLIEKGRVSKAELHHLRASLTRLPRDLSDIVDYGLEIYQEELENLRRGLETEIEAQMQPILDRLKSLPQPEVK